MLFDNVNWNGNNFFQIPGTTMMEEQIVSDSTSKFLSPEEGFMRGNIIRNEYDAYKNMTYFKLIPETEREKLLFKLMAYCFALNDLNLYLDLNPEDKMAFDLFKNYAKEKMEIEKKYTDTYGPVSITEIQGNSFTWLKNPWPWDKVGGSNYV